MIFGMLLVCVLLVSDVCWFDIGGTVYDSVMSDGVIDHFLQFAHADILMTLWLCVMRSVVPR